MARSNPSPQTIVSPLATLAKAVPLLVLLLLPDALGRDEAYAGIDYGYALLALLGSAGCLGYLASRLSSRLDSLPIRARTILVPARSDTSGDAIGEDWPLLVGLVFGPLILLLAGLGGWV